MAEERERERERLATAWRGEEEEGEGRKGGLEMQPPTGGRGRIGRGKERKSGLMPEY